MDTQWRIDGWMEERKNTCCVTLFWLWIQVSSVESSCSMTSDFLSRSTHAGIIIAAEQRAYLQCVRWQNAEMDTIHPLFKQLFSHFLVTFLGSCDWGGETACNKNNPLFLTSVANTVVLLHHYLQYLSVTFIYINLISNTVLELWICLNLPLFRVNDVNVKKKKKIQK